MKVKDLRAQAIVVRGNSLRIAAIHGQIQGNYEDFSKILPSLGKIVKTEVSKGSFLGFLVDSWHFGCIVTSTKSSGDSSGQANCSPRPDDLDNE